MSLSPAPLAPSSVPHKSERIAARAVEGKAVVVVLDARKLHTLNRVGARIFELCDGQRDIAAIARVIATEFDVDEVQAEHDALQFIGQLVGERAVEVKR